jgi:hypothetical protein
MERHFFAWHVIDCSNEEEEVYELFSRLRSTLQKLYWNGDGRQEAIAERDRLNAIEQWDLNYPPEKVQDMLLRNAVPYPGENVFEEFNMKVLDD